MSAPRLVLEDQHWGRQPGVRTGWCARVRLNGQVYLPVEWSQERARDRTLEDLVLSLGGGRHHYRRLEKLNFPERFHYTWVYDLRVPARWRGQGMARQALAYIQKKDGAVLVLRVAAANHARMSPSARRKVYRRLGFTLLRVGREVFAVRLPLEGNP